MAIVKSTQHFHAGFLPIAADILYVAPILLLLGVAMSGATAYATLRLYIRR